MDVGDGLSLQVAILGVAVDSLQSLQHGLARGEHTVSQQECVEEVYA